MKTFCVTIDTEPDCDVHWRRSQPLTFESVTFGIPKILRPIWDRFRIVPVYFVTPEVMDNDLCCRTLKDEIKRGAEIGAHLHSEYIEPKRKYQVIAGTASDEFPCYAYDTGVESEKIKNLTALIEKNLGIRPVSYRAARYGADLDTIKILEKLGFKVDSSLTPEINWQGRGGPDHTKSPRQPYFISQTDLYSAGNSPILEVPITISGKRIPFLTGKWMYYRWLRPTHMTGFEMKGLIAEFAGNYAEPVLNMMFHSMEVLPGKTPFVRTKFGQKMYLGRLESVLKYMVRMGFESRTLAAVYEIMKADKGNTICAE
ncbi:MAG: hypothetical protein JW749_05870 [Sedimentisphaerales bacterium]|nr:hypothetical protein [Sedimentisphaerales bacterium]